MESLLPLTHWHWFIAAVLLGVLELAAPGAFFLWLGISAAITGFLLLALPDLGWGYQVIAFTLLSIVTVLFFRRFLLNKTVETDHPTLNQRGAQNIGKVVTLIKDSENKRSKVKIGDSLWSVDLSEDLKEGTSVEITDTEGSTLKAKKV